MTGDPEALLQFNCPVCGEENQVQRETLEHEEGPVQDCWVCCRPLVLHYDGVQVVAEPEQD